MFEVLTGILQDKLGVDASDATRRFDRLVADNRYRVDVWASS